MTYHPYLPEGFALRTSDSGKQYVHKPLGNGLEMCFTLRQWLRIQAGEGAWRDTHISVFGATPEKTALAALDAEKDATAYADYLKASQAAQARYIRAERKRYKKAGRLWAKYKAAMGELGVHPLQGREITDRLRQLDDMEKAIPETHGDTPGQRAVFEARQSEAAS